ncbi:MULTISPECIES: hypothetical protein [Pseudonocardia]|uniref:Uncharacterized protein n=2 Tax=Pseudonocardia TaxID=1847 RepID=A0A1Y2N777_PSEAH|nr:MULTISPECIES: hypothetical protein [Pseudonocardia]OSY43320.1 hypothetical protein BG845_00925 [Pseudonocardia autotrophica]TDN71808.1 hypothetical protein C8E95_0842 [Pseudonocardia autotrophica]BBG02495.1 hypothetical protein Pdca_37040 [Pseudonocardia autotrophica]GEC26924.1 hypothetical protein PSA01_39530 [Pseudonocardia saturnea]
MTESSRPTVLGLVADPGLPTEFAHRLARELPGVLDRDADGSWEVRVSDDRIALDEHGALPMTEIGERARDREDLDAVVLITDLPRRAGSDPVVADGATGSRVGLVSLPALGAFDQYRRCRDTVVQLVTRHLFPSREREGVGQDSDAGRAGSLTRLDPDDTGAADADGDDRSGSAGVEDEVDVRLSLTGLRGRIRLLAGMVRANRPWRLVPSLSPAIAAAAAGAAFGIFYSNIWELATALSVGRQATITLVALIAMTTWLILDNGLWESRRSRSLREEMLLSNLSTVLTVAFGVLTMYVLLFGITLTAAALVIPPDYLGTNIMREAGFDDYLMIAVLSASMGTIAGALGSGFADEGAVRQAAYSRREQERRARLDRDEEPAGSR